ncbi:MAG: nucleotidyltransferase domain-containing protein [Candidatus Omnitrophica bacterium]|nr:nucleotidyltransferase domain-containing protein [Candidatus Omnitrophota bacterium]
MIPIFFRPVNSLLLRAGIHNSLPNLCIMHTIVCRSTIGPMKQLLSQNRLLLLGLFYTNPEKSFYMQEVGRTLGKKPGVFQRALNSLTEEGLLKSEYRGHARFFQADTRHPLYPELKRIVAKTTGVEGTLRNLVERLPEVRVALIYGSFAKGGQRKDSDIDLLVVGKPSVEDKLVREITRLEKKLQREINYKLYSEDEYRQKRNKNDPFLEEVLTDRKIPLKGNPNAA